MSNAAKKTPIYGAHVASGGKFINFAGYDLPVQYQDGILQEHLWTREKCGIFDVSHMGQIIFKDQSEQGVEKLSNLFSLVTPSNFRKLKPLTCKYTALLNRNGGIVDDLIVTKLTESEYFAVLNASRKEIDLKHISDNSITELNYNSMFDTRSLIAVQGPRSLNALSEIIPEVSSLGYMKLTQIDHQKFGPIFLSRTGYTGEFGFEVSLLNNYALNFWNLLLENPDVKPIGLGARDSLRLEVGYPLYGNDLDETKTPIESRIEFVVSKYNTSFFGYEKIHSQLTSGPESHRCGIRMIERGVLRKGNPIYLDNIEVGQVSSGCFSPILSKSIGNCYISIKIPLGTKVEVEIRGNRYPAEICSMDFYESKVR